MAARRRTGRRGRWQARDPHWITAKYLGVCVNSECGKLIEPGDAAYYFPNGAKLYCAECGKVEAASFEATKMDEDVLGPAAGACFGRVG